MHRVLPLLLLAAATAAAQPPAPSDPAAPAAPRQHCSPLRPAAAASEPPPRDWVEANTAVQRAGGWRQYAKEAARGEPARAPCSEVKP